MDEDKQSGQSQPVISLDPVVDLLEGVVSRLKTARTVGDVFFGVGEVDSWQLRGTESPETGLCRIREGIQTLQKIMAATFEIAAAAEGYIQISKAKLVGLGLLSLPVELLQGILYRSLIRNSKTGPYARIDLKRVLALQSISRYFRDVVRSTPEFWTSVSYKNIPLLELQLERSRPLGLNLELVASELLDSKLHNIIATHSSRWRTLSLVLQTQDVNLGGAVQERVSPLTLGKLRSLDLHVGRSWGWGFTRDIVKFDIVTPELTRLGLFDCQPHNIAANLTEFCFSFNNCAAWSGYNLILVIASQRTLKKLVLRVCCRPDDSKERTDRLIADLSPACDRNMFVSLKFDGSPYTTSLVQLWPSISSFGIATLELDFTNMGFVPPHASLRGVAYYPHDTPGLETLIFSFSSYRYAYSGRFEDIYNEKLEFPSSLQTVLIRNACRESMDIVYERLSRLIARQEALGSAHPVDVVFSGRVPPDNDLPAEVLVRRVNCFSFV